MPNDGTTQGAPPSTGAAIVQLLMPIVFICDNVFLYHKASKKREGNARDVIIY